MEIPLESDPLSAYIHIGGDDLAPGTTIMSWRGTVGGIEAAKKGLDLKTVYDYDPYEGMEPGTEQQYKVLDTMHYNYRRY